jgi:hypothetical protein
MFKMLDIWPKPAATIGADPLAKKTRLITPPICSAISMDFPSLDRAIPSGTLNAADAPVPTTVAAAPLPAISVYCPATPPENPNADTFLLLLSAMISASQPCQNPCPTKCPELHEHELMLVEKFDDSVLMGQLTGSTESIGQYWFTGHGLQACVSPDFDPLPKNPGLHTHWEISNEPATMVSEFTGQITGAVEAMVQYPPFGQTKQSALPPTALYIPTPHGLQDVPLGPVKPGLHTQFLI